MSFRLLYPEGWEDTGSDRMKNYDFIRTLAIDQMIVLVNESFRGYTSLHLENYFSTDVSVLEYRQGVVEDLVNHPEIYDMFRSSIPVIHHITEMRRTLSRSFSTESALYAIRYMEMYQEIVHLYYEGVKDAVFASEGMQGFQKHILAIAGSDEFRNMDSRLSSMQRNFGAVKSITVGINLDLDLLPVQAGILSVNEKPFREGTVIEKLTLKNSEDRKNVLLSDLYPLQNGLHREEIRTLNLNIQSALNTIFQKSIRGFEPIVQQYFRTTTNFFANILDDIRFLTAGVSFIRDMQELGMSMCRPGIRSVEEKCCSLTDVYNANLARSRKETVIVSNSFAFDENARFYLVTGPNHGGKSIFAYSVGIAQALFQLGLMVPAREAVMSPVTGIFTHFPTSDEDNYGKGRLESECARLSEILEQLTDTDMLLMDESFSSTSGLEAGYIASEVLTGIGIIGCCGIFVTHIHDLPQHTEEYNSHPDNRGKIDNLVALMASREDGTRSYRIARTTPDGLSYARDIAMKHGLSLPQILEKIRREDGAET